MKSLLLEIGVSTTEYDKIIDIKESKADYQKSVTDIIDVALNVIVLVILIFLTIAVLVTYISFLRNRENEYCLYTSIGFSREEVYAMIMREVFFIFGSSIFLGVIISILVMVILGKGVIEPMGLQYTYYYPQHLLKLFAAFVAMIGILQIPIVITIYKIKQIDRIEE